jgi:hypothetical protein
MAATTRNTMLSATDREAALGRIGCAGLRGRTSDWHIVDWFIRLARSQKPFHEMAMIEVESLRQEYRALQEVLQEKTGGLTQNVVTLEALEKFRSAVRTHLEQLADLGQTTFGPFTLTRYVAMPRQHTSSVQVYSRDFVEPYEGQGLLYHLSVLIGKIGLAILRCPYCTQIFLRARADAEHCSRSCQANAHARRQREAAKVANLQSKEKLRIGKHKRLRKPMKIQQRPPSKLAIVSHNVVSRKPGKQKPAKNSQ